MHSVRVPRKHCNFLVIDESILHDKTMFRDPIQKVLRRPVVKTLASISRCSGEELAAQ